MVNVAVVGSTGLVGQKMLQILEERKFPVNKLTPVASRKSSGKTVTFMQRDHAVTTLEELDLRRIDVALFSAGGAVSREWAPRFAEAGVTVIDNSSAWRMEPYVPLIVPEINGSILKKTDKIIANPNCSTIQMVMALKPLHDKYGLEKVVVSTYQSVTGSGYKAVQQLEVELKGDKPPAMAYPHTIAGNCLPHIDVFMDNGFTREEMKMVWETRKILNLPDLPVSPTAVRVPVTGGHSEAVYVELKNIPEVEEVRDILNKTPGVTVVDAPEANQYPMPLTAHDKDDVFVGRIRKDVSNPHALNLWIVSDNLRKGAATNAVQIAEYVVNKKLLEYYE